ncbi:MAG: M20/M25/M40 family metallo-hydrolase [Anaerolineae bacterium]|nr:M20/M25/M40 family metallo-hydrolase [Anaerolineae bacterium]
MLELAKRLTEAFGVSGFEEEIRAAIRDEIAPVVDEIKVDVLGNLVALRRGTGGGRRVMLAAHMDQIGLMVTHVDEKGYLRFAPIGGIYPLTCWGKQVRFTDGTVGTVGLDGRAKRDEAPTLKDMFIDVGATSKAEVKQKVGDVATFIYPFVAQGNAWFASNHDDRIGCIVLAQLLRELQGAPIAHDIYAVFTTQEEVGLRGATTSAYAIEPEIGIALDVTLTGDLPYATPAMEVALGKGVAIKVQDSGMISHSGLNRLLIAAAEANGIPYQLEVLHAGTTDARNIQISRAGVPATCLSIPSRHVHTPSQLVDRRDVEAAIALLKALLAGPIELS